MLRSNVSACLCAVFTTCGVFSQAAFPQTPIELDPIIITVNRTPESAGKLGSAASVIDRSQIAAARAETVLDVLETVPGLTVFRSGGIGSTASVSIRGAESDQTLVMIDGIRLNDPASTGSEFDFSVFSLSNVERIEIIRGPQSGVYGSDAIGGVINIITRKGEPGQQAVVEVEGGSFKTFAQRAHFSGSKDDISVSVAASNFRTSGFSRFSGGTEDDAARKRSLNARIDYDPSPIFGLTVTGGRYELDAELDSAGLTSGRDADDNVERFLTLASATARLNLLNGDFQNKLTAFFSQTERSFFDDNGAGSSPLIGRTSEFDGTSTGVEYQGELKVRDIDRLIFGGRLDYQNGTSFDVDEIAGISPRYDVDETWRSAFMLYSFNPTNALSLSAAGRIDEFGDVATESTYRLTAAYRIPETGTKLRASYGTGAKTPTIQQRFEDSGFAIGNPDLDVETSTGFDVGVDQQILDGSVTISGSYFSNDIKDLISAEFDPSTFKFLFVNVDQAKIDGVELSASWIAADWVTLTGAYTYLDAVDSTTGLALSRRPEHAFSLRAAMRPTDRLALGVNAIYVGERFNRSDERDLLDDYIRVDLDGSYDLRTDAEVFFRAENIFDADYEEIKDFGTAGRSAYIGLRARF